ncbi:hypothetical protein ACS94_00040 [Bacillus cereus]|nr:hypothetical protein ACS94_00040 [Bacillus cereus]
MTINGSVVVATQQTPPQPRIPTAYVQTALPVFVFFSSLHRPTTHEPETNVPDIKKKKKKKKLKKKKKYKH